MPESELIYRIATLLLLFSTLGVSGFYRRRADREGGALNPDGGRLLLLVRLTGLLIILPLILYLVNPSWVEWARLDLPAWLRWLGAALVALMIPLFVWLFRTIGSNISPSHTTRSAHELITTGPYRYIRHPLYTFGFLVWAGLGLLTALWWMLAALAFLLLFFVYRLPKEEAFLEAAFGDEYRRYRARTGAFMPRVG